MRYWVIAEDGQMYGPADVPTLNQWVAEGRVVPTTLLQPENSQMRLAASTVAGLNFGQSQTFAAYTPQYIGSGQAELRNAWLCFALGFIACCPYTAIAPLIGVALGFAAQRKGASGATLAIGLNIILAIARVAIQFMGQSYGLGGFDPGQLQDTIRRLSGSISFA